MPCARSSAGSRRVPVRRPRAATASSSSASAGRVLGAGVSGWHCGCVVRWSFPEDTMAKHSRVDPSVRPDVEAEAPGELLHGLRVLVIDDHEDARQVVAEYLDYLGATVTVASAGQEGLILYRDVMPDVVVTDIAMPKMDGYQVA